MYVPKYYSLSTNKQTTINSSSSLYKPTIGSINSNNGHSTVTSNAVGNIRDNVSSVNNQTTMSRSSRPLPPSNKNQPVSTSRYMSSNILPDISKKTTSKLTSQSPLSTSSLGSRTRSPSVGTSYMQQPIQQNRLVTQFNDLNISSYPSGYNNNSSGSKPYVIHEHVSSSSSSQQQYSNVRIEFSFY
jgi:hypothetical protein